MGVSKVVYGDNTLVDLTNDSVSETTLAKGVTAHNAAGEQVTGIMEAGTSVTKETITEALGYTPTKAWYVTFTVYNGDNITADKTVAEIYQAYQDGYAVYGLCDPTILCPIAISSDIAAFGVTYTDTQDYVQVILLEWNSEETKWVETTFSAPSTNLIKNAFSTIGTNGIKNPHALTINSGGTTITYDGSEAKTINISSSGTDRSPLIVNITVEEISDNTPVDCISDKTITEIYSAYINGQLVLAEVNSSTRLQLTECDSTMVMFDCVFYDGDYYVVEVLYTDGKWTFTNRQLSVTYATKAEIPDESTLVNKVLAALPTWTGGSY